MSKQDTTHSTDGGVVVEAALEGQTIVDVGVGRRYEGLRVYEIGTERGYSEGTCEIDGAQALVRWYPSGAYWVRVYGTQACARGAGGAADEQGITASQHETIVCLGLSWYAANSHRDDHVFDPPMLGMLFTYQLEKLVRNRLYYGHRRIAEMASCMTVEQQVDDLLKHEIKAYLGLAELIARARILCDLGIEAEWRYLVEIAGRYGVDLPRAVTFTCELLALLAEKPFKKTGFPGEHTKPQVRFAAQFLGIRRNEEARLWERDAELARGRENEARLRRAIKIPEPGRGKILEALARDGQVRVKVHVATAPDEGAARAQLHALGCDAEPYLAFAHESVYAATVGSEEQLDRLLDHPCVGRIEPMPVFSTAS